jgi:photosystem II stability/assembly factor-like uncharacterized protein
MTETIAYASTKGSGLYRSTDSGETWSPIAANEPGLNEVYHLAVEPVGGHRIFAKGARVWYLSTDHGESWTEISPYGSAEDVVWTAGSTLYVATNYGLVRSVNGGDSWSPATGALGQVPGYSLATVTDTDRVFLYVGTTGGRVQETGSLAQGIAAGEDLVNAGVYRYTTRLLKKLYLPLILRSAP